MKKNGIIYNIRLRSLNKIALLKIVHDYIARVIKIKNEISSKFIAEIFK